MKKGIFTAISAILLTSTTAFAETTSSKINIDVTGMLSQVDFTPVIAAIIAAGGLLIGPRIAKMGIRFVLGLFGR